MPDEKKEVEHFVEKVSIDGKKHIAICACGFETTAQASEEKARKLLDKHIEEA